jgi:glycosyltransferase involved in cell wall biosynthesis
MTEPLPDLPSGSISAAVVVYNEEAVIERCLESLHDVVDEIVLVHDGPCQDRTLEIAERFGCRIFERPSWGSPEHHTVFAYEQCRGEWLLNLDGDEYLSAALREGLRELVSRSDVNGWWLRWRMWDGRRYITNDGPFKLVLFRKDATRFVGFTESWETVEGTHESTDLDLGHEPLENNFALRRMWTKWWRKAGLQASEYMMDYREIPKFHSAEQRWPFRRRALNAVSPVAFLPIGVATFVVMLIRQRAYYTARENLRFAAHQGIYSAILNLRVAELKYLKRR